MWHKKSNMNMEKLTLIRFMAKYPYIALRVYDNFIFVIVLWVLREKGEKN